MNRDRIMGGGGFQGVSRGLLGGLNISSIISECWKCLEEREREEEERDRERGREREREKREGKKIKLWRYEVTAKRAWGEMS
jgi:hypothetical protein